MRRAFIFLALLALVAARPAGEDKPNSEEKNESNSTEVDDAMGHLIRKREVEEVAENGEANSTEPAEDAAGHLIRKREVDEVPEHGENETTVAENEEPKVVPIESARRKRDNFNSMFNPTTPPGFLSNLQNGASNAWNAAQPGLQQMGQGIQGAAENAWSSVQQGANSAVQGVQTFGNQIDQAAGNLFGQPSTPNMFPFNNGNNMFGQPSTPNMFPFNNGNNMFGQPSTPNMFPFNNGMPQSSLAPYYMGVTVPGSPEPGFFQKAGNWFKNIFSG